MQIGDFTVKYSGFKCFFCLFFICLFFNGNGGKINSTRFQLTECCPNFLDSLDDCFCPKFNWVYEFLRNSSCGTFTILLLKEFQIILLRYRLQLFFGLLAFTIIHSHHAMLFIQQFFIMHVLINFSFWSSFDIQQSRLFQVLFKFVCNHPTFVIDRAQGVLITHQI